MRHVVPTLRIAKSAAGVAVASLCLAAGPAIAQESYSG